MIARSLRNASASIPQQLATAQGLIPRVAKTGDGLAQIIREASPPRDFPVVTTAAGLHEVSVVGDMHLHSGVFLNTAEFFGHINNGWIQFDGQAEQSRYGKDLLRRRGMHIERSFAHLPNYGGVRRATLCGQANLHERYKIAAVLYDPSQLIRRLFGIETSKQVALFS